MTHIENYGNFFQNVSQATGMVNYPDSSGNVQDNRNFDAIRELPIFLSTFRNNLEQFDDIDRVTVKKLCRDAETAARKPSEARLKGIVRQLLHSARSVGEGAFALGAWAAWAAWSGFKGG